LVLGLVTLGALAACGRNGEDGGTSEDTTDAVTTPAPDGPPADDPPTEGDEGESGGDVPPDEPFDPLGRFDETVYVTQTRILAAWMGFDEGRDEDNNWWTDAYYERLNVRLTNLFTAPNWGGDFDMMMNLAFATGDLPDVMPLYTSLAVRAMEGNLVMDLTDVFERYASQQVKDIYAFDPRALEAWTVDGRLMGLSEPAAPGDFPFFWVPASMLDEFNGGVIPTTFDEINELAHWVRAHTGRYAVGMDNNLAMMESIMPVFGATPQWIERGGEMVWGRVQPEMRDTWQQLAEWYADGILALDFAVRTTDDVEADFMNRHMGLFMGGAHVPNGPGRNFILNNQDDDLVAIPVMRADGTPVNVTIGAGYNNALMISARAENPAAIMRMFNLSTAITNEGEHRPYWVVDDHWNMSPEWNMEWWNRMATGTGMVADVRYNATLMALESILAGSDGSELVEARSFGAVGAFNTITGWVNYGAAEPGWEGNWALWNMTLGSESLATARRMFDLGHITPTPRWGADTTPEAEHSTNLMSRFVEFATLAIMNNDVDSQFEQWVNFFESNGGAEINAEVAAWWAEHGR